MRSLSGIDRYERVREDMRTGDIVAFSGNGRILQLIKMCTQSQISHVGIIVRGDFGLGLGDSVMLVESTTFADLRDELTGKLIKGVQMHWLSKRLSSYHGKAWWHALKMPLSTPQVDSITGWLRETHDREVPYDAVQALGAGMDFWGGLGLSNDPDFARLFCSELCAHALQVAGRLPTSVNASEETPASLLAHGVFAAGVEIK